MSSRGPPIEKRRVGRTPGAKNQDHDERRLALARKVLRAVIASGGHPSLHEIARSTDASIPTLKHYFGDRSGAVAEALRTVERDASQHLRTIADPGKAGLSASLLKVATDLAAAWTQFGVGPLFAAGLSAGLFDPLAGPGYIDGVLEPTVLALEQRLRTHALRKELQIAASDELGIRTAALAFLSPLLVALLHQHDLSGNKCRPLDLPAFSATHVERFVAGYGRPTRKKPARRATR